MNKDNYIWFEKYRPKKIEDFILEDSVKSLVTKYVDEKNLEHIIFHGSYGTGKTSLSNFLIKELNAEALSLNASNKDERGIDVVNDVIIPFAQKTSFSRFKVVDLREGEKLTIDAQDALKDVIEEYNENCKFIFTTNNINKINGGIRSRCVEVFIQPTDVKEVARRLWHIVQSEDIKATKKDVMSLAEAYFPDIRKTVKMLQYYSKTGILENKFGDRDNTVKIMNIIKDSVGKDDGVKYKNWIEIRNIIHNMEVDNKEQIYSLLYKDIDKYIPQKLLIKVFIIISEYMYRTSQVVDKETMVSSCMLDILQNI